MNRRGFMSSILALGVAPAIVRAESIMRIKPILLPAADEFAMILKNGRIAELCTFTAGDGRVLVSYYGQDVFGDWTLHERTFDGVVKDRQLVVANDYVDKPFTLYEGQIYSVHYPLTTAGKVDPTVPIHFDPRGAMFL